MMIFQFSKMKYLIYLLSALSLTFAIRVPSAWQQELQLGSLGRYEGIRPPRHGNQIKIQLPHVIVKTSQQKTRHRNPNRAYYSSPVNRNKHTPHFPKKFENTIIKSVLPKYVGHKKPYGYSKQKIPIYKKSIGQFPKQSPLVFYMTPNPKTVNVFTSTQPHIPHERAVHKFSISTSNLPFQNSEQLPENYINRQSQLERFGELPSFTTSIPPHHNVDGVFSKPTGFMTVESIQNKVDDHFLDKFSDELQPYNREYDGKNSEQDSDISSRYKSLESISNHKFENHLYKNYRDDKTQEPSLYDQDIDLEDLPKVHRDESEKGPISSHEIPGEIPTRPIYPGPGKWAKPGIKHKPFISRQKYETLGGNEEKPDGYDTFLEGEKLFNKLNGKFGENLQSFPEEHKLGKFLEKKTSNPINNKSNNKLEESQTEEGYDHEKDNDEFVPMRLYAQVRRSEDTKHFPADESEDSRLREAIKESKVQTVYTEEGYDDSAYDHAGHEKQAENEEAFEGVDREKQKVEEEKVPAQKYNLHLQPKYESTAYGDEDGLPTDEEIEEYKREKLGLEDSDLAGSQFGESPNQIHEVDGGDTTTEARIPEPKMKSNNNFISTKETKTMTTKRKNDGDTETEISSRVKIIMQPNNSTRTRKYVKVYPKILMGNSENKNTLKQKIGEEEVASVEQISFEQKPNKTLRGIYIEEIITTTPTEVPVTTVSPPEFTELFTEEIPTTTSPTTAIPSIKETSTRKDIPETLESIEKAFWSIGSRSRRKRFTNDFPDEKVDTDFISKINHDLGKPSEDLMHVKYPYYNDNEKYGINENSPLRYSEDLKNIPLKKEGDMTFYEQAESLAGCPEIDSTIDPIPDRIRNAEVKGDDSEEYEDEDEEDTEVVENPKSENEKSVSLPDQPKSPRLTGLGDRIDCLKAIYFGKNPLDSPIFAEETVGGVKPIFEDFQKRKLIEIDSNTTNGTMVGDMPSTNEIMSSPDRKHEHDLSSPQPNNNTDYFYPEQNKPLNPYTSTTTSDTPTTLDVEKMVLSVFNDINQHMKTEISNGDDKTPQTTVQTVSSINILTTPQYTIDLKPKHIYDQIQLLSHLPGKNDSTNNQSNAVKLVPNVGIKEVPKETIQTNQTSRQGKEHGNENIQTPESSVNMPTFLDDGNSLPDAEALRRRKKIRIMRKPPRFHIAAPRRIPSTTTQPIFTKHMTASTVLPKYKVVSEVFYKDDIKPNEQLQVLTDIMNNIMNSSQKSESEASDEFSEPVSVTLSKNRIDLLKNSKNHHGDSYLKAYSDQEVDDSYYASTITSTTRPNVHEAVPSYNFESIENGLEKYHPTDKFRLYSALLEAKKKHNLEKMISTTPEYEKTVSSHQHVPHHQVTRVMGLMPPGTNQFKTIYHPKRDNKHHFTNPGSIEKKIINNFLVMGMKPPPKQRFFLYADFANNNHLRNRKNPLRRGKRSTNRMSYAQLSRNREQQEESVKDDSDDDYVPHRPMNFYYDEKTGKIIYNKDKNADAEKDDEDLEYIEVVEDLPETTQKPKPKQNPIFATATPPPEGQSYIDFVNRLKNSSEYQLIPDPTTTEKGAEAITEKVISTTEIAKSTSPPEFLSILQKVRDDSEYKFIEDKKDKKDNKVMSTTTVTPEEFAEEEEDEEEETAPTNVKNSPGGVQHDYPKEGFQIFDISDYIPKLKNYLPKTSIDTSRYKTIQRPTHAPILEVESDSEEEKVPETTNTNRKITEDKNMEVAADTLREETITNEREEESSYQPLGSTTDTIIPMGHSPTTSPIEKIRRRRPTTRRSVVTTKRHTPVTVSSLDTIEHQKARRNYRRRPLRIKVTSTTEKFPDEEVDDTTRVLRRRSNAYNPELTGNLDGTTGTPTTSRKLTNPRKIGPRRYVEIVKKYNHNKRLEGNLSGDDKNRYPLQHVRGTHRRSKDIEVISEYDPSEKHGGNYKRENEDVVKDNNNETLPKQELNEPVLGASRKGENVEVIGDFDKEKKHGGNYNYENEADVDKPEAIYTKTKNENEDDVDKLEAIYTKTNEMQEPNEELSRVDLLPISSSEDEKSDLEDAEVKTSISKGISAKPSSRSNKPKKTIVKQKKRFRERTKPVQRLTDVVTKPETFYTDTTLPRSINLLVTDTLSSEELGAFSEETSSGEIEKDVEITSGQASNTNSTSEKKPSFIEDPSKRLYYYAPI